MFCEMYDHTTSKTTVSKKKAVKLLRRATYFFNALLTVYKKVMIFVAIKTMLDYIQGDMKVSWEARYFFITTK